MRLFTLFFALMLVLGGASPSRADAPVFSGAWVDASGRISEADLQQVLDGLAQQQADPQHIVFLVHGFATPRADSTAQFTTIGREVHAAFASRGKRVAVLGLQWDSDIAKSENWVMDLVTGILHLSPDDPYKDKVQMGRAVGRYGARQVVFAVHERFPNAQIDLFAHSLGSEVVRFAMAPKAPDSTKPKTSEAFRADDDVPVGVVCLAGADLDYDVLSRYHVSAEALSGVGAYWLTQTSGGLRPYDIVLNVRRVIRGRAAMGDRFPQFTVEQLDALCSRRQLILDTRAIPRNHDILGYFNQDRVQRLADMAIAIKDPSTSCEHVDALNAVLAAPNTVEALRPFLDHKESAVQFYATWRMENLLCGSPRHIADGYTERVFQMLRNNPAALEVERPKSICVDVRNGYWPTPRQVAKALRELPALEGSGGTRVPAGMP